MRSCSSRAWKFEEVRLTDTASQLVDKMISHYRIVEKLGGGGVVYNGEETDLGGYVALM